VKLIVGLGNPGILYQATRHNIGFNVVKQLAQRQSASFKKDRFACALSAKIKIDNFTVLLAMPLTFMNLSGQAVSALLKKYKIGIQDALIVCDDLDLEFGRMKIKGSGSSAGHRGIQSIIENIDSRDFCRLRIGISRLSLDAAEYVLKPFTKKERVGLVNIIDRAADCCEYWVTRGVSETMNMFNVRSRGVE